MIELIPYRGAVVKVLDQQEIREAYACREALEHLVAKEVIERVRQEDIDRLYRMIEGFRQRRAWRRSPPPARNSMSTFIS